MVDKPFEEVSDILDRSGDVVEILVETGRRLSPISPNASNPMLKADSEDNDLGMFELNPSVFSLGVSGDCLVLRSVESLVSAILCEKSFQ